MSTQADFDIYAYKNEFFKFTKKRIGTIVDTVQAEMQSGLVFQNNCKYKINSAGFIDIEVTGDDNITKLIPKTLFTEEKITLHIGENYGYFINTELSKNGGHYLSSVILLSVERTYVDDYHYEVKIQPVMQLEYAFITRKTYTLFLRNYDDDNRYARLINLYLSGTEGKVLPLLRVESKKILNIDEYYMRYRESDFFTISDISFASNIQNINSLNYGDAGYSAYNDNGYFFNGTTYEYSASKFKNENDFVGAVKEIGEGIVSSAIGYVPVIGDFLVFHHKL